MTFRIQQKSKKVNITFSELLFFGWGGGVSLHMYFQNSTVHILMIWSKRHLLKSLNMLTSTFLVGVVSVSRIPQRTVHFTTGGSQQWLLVLAMVSSLPCYLGLHCIDPLLFSTFVSEKHFIWLGVCLI